MNKKDLYIYGAGGAGRELSFSLETNTQWRVAGFIDDTPELAGKVINGIPVVGGIASFDKRDAAIVVCIVDKPTVKRTIVTNAKKLGHHNFPVVIGSPTSFVAPSVKFKEGCLISMPFDYISVDVDFGEFVFVNCTTRIGHDVKIGAYTTIFSGIDIGGHVEIGADCVIGSGSVINPGIRIGDGSIIGGGSVVVKDIPAGVIAAGCPARRIK